MGIFDKYKAEYKVAAAADLMAGEEYYYLYQDFLKDLENGVDRLELWEKTLGRCEGDKVKVEELYSLYRNIDLTTNKRVTIMFGFKEKYEFYIKYDEVDLYSECITAIEDKGYSLKADGVGGLVIYKSSILSRRKHFMARVATLKELCKLVEDTNLEELEAQSIADNIKPEEICLFNECTKILEKKGYVLKVDGAHSFTINCLISTSPNNLNLVVKAKTTSLPELYKLAKECDKTKMERNRWYFWAIALSVVAAVLIQNLFFISLMIIIVAAFLAFEPESDDISFTVSDKKDEPEANNLHKVTSNKQPLNRQMWEELLTIAKEFKKLSTSDKIYLIIFLALFSIMIWPGFLPLIF